jgi:hypothetical protein
MVILLMKSYSEQNSLSGWIIVCSLTSSSFLSISGANLDENLGLSVDPRMAPDGAEREKRSHSALVFGGEKLISKETREKY